MCALQGIVDDFRIVIIFVEITEHARSFFRLFLVIDFDDLNRHARYGLPPAVLIDNRMSAQNFEELVLVGDFDGVRGLIED